MKMSFVHLIWVLVALLGLPSLAFACRCAGPVPPATAYRNAQVVVQGKILAVKGDINKEGATARVEVSKAWKKKIKSELEVSTRTTCAYEFHVGEEYLIYLQQTADGGHYSTKKCVGNVKSAEAGNALTWLERHGAPQDVDNEWPRMSIQPYDGQLNNDRNVP